MHCLRRLADQHDTNLLVSIATRAETATIFAGLDGEVLPGGGGALAAAGDGGDSDSSGSGRSDKDEGASPPRDSPVAGADVAGTPASQQRQPRLRREQDGAASAAATPPAGIGGGARQSKQRQRPAVSPAAGASGSPAAAQPITRDINAAASSDGAGPSTATDNCGGGQDDAHILRELFDGTSVLGALDHSKIEVHMISQLPSWRSELETQDCKRRPPELLAVEAPSCRALIPGANS